MPGIRVRSRKQQKKGVWLPTDFQHHTGFSMPDPITFCVAPEYLNRPLYPRQATLLKVIFLRLDLLTEYDLGVIAEWEESFRKTGNNGITPGILDRMQYLKDHGYHWFRELVLVMGRRAGKGYVCALAMAYVLWYYMHWGDPQDQYGIDRDKRLECLIYAGRKDQARDNLWRDLYHIVKGAPCFGPYRGKPMGESFSVFAPSDLKNRYELARQGIAQSGPDEATFKIYPLPATPMSGRGGAACMLGFDEFGHMVATGANRSAEEVWVAATPSLDQFDKDAFIVQPSSPWEMTGQFYTNWLRSQEVDERGQPVYPEVLMLQLTSWDIYVDWEQAPELDLFPDDFGGDLGEYLEVDPPRLGALKKAVQSYDEAMQRLEKADPDMFAVERLSHWQTSMEAYLDPKKVLQMFEMGSNLYNQPVHGVLSQYYKAHGDPSLVNDNFGFAVAHTERNDEGFEVAVFDYIHHWDPSEWPDHTIDYVEINKEMWELVKLFPIDDLSFDQYQSNYFVADMTKKAMTARLPKRINVHVVPSTAQRNLKVAENFKIAINQGWVIAPYYEQADLELRFLQFKNGKVDHPTLGPVQHDDVARSMMEVVWGLLERQVVEFLVSGTPGLSGTSIGGNRPWMAPDSQDQQVFQQFGGAARAPRGGSIYSPARGRPDFALGKGPFPRTPPGGRPGYGAR